MRIFLKDRKRRVVIHGNNSEWRPVILFVIYINDLPDTLNSETYLFADDTKIFRVITGENDQQLLQENLNRMEKWCDTWLLKLHAGKCVHMYLGKNSIKDFSYHLADTTLKKSDAEKDLGVIIDSNLEFEKHIFEKIKRANMMMAIIRRAFINLDRETFILLYKSLVRTHMDFASAIWFPYKTKYIEKIEGVQRRATKLVAEVKHLSYPERLKCLKLPTLSFRRQRGDMIELYKIIHGKYDLEVTGFLKLWENVSNRSGNRGNSLKIYPQQCSRMKRKHSFLLRTVNVWNGLPVSVVCANNVAPC